MGQRFKIFSKIFSLFHSGHFEKFRDFQRILFLLFIFETETDINIGTLYLIIHWLAPTLYFIYGDLIHTNDLEDGLTCFPRRWLTVVC